MSDLIERQDALKAIEAEECLGYVECQTTWLTDRINAIPAINYTGSVKIFDWICSHPDIWLHLSQSDYIHGRCIRLEMRCSPGYYVVNLVHMFEFDKWIDKEGAVIYTLDCMYDELMRKSKGDNR